MAGTSVSDGDINVSSAAQAAIHGAVALLAPHAREPRIAALIGKAQAIASPVGEGDEAVSKALRGLDALRKSDDMPAESRRLLDKSSRDLQLEALRAQNPRGAEVYERARAVAA